MSRFRKTGGLPSVVLSTLLRNMGLTNSFLSSEFFKILTGAISPINFPNIPAFPSLQNLENGLTGLNGNLTLAELEVERILRNQNRSGQTILTNVIEGEVVHSKVNDGVANIQESFNVVQDGAAPEPLDVRT